MRRHALRYEETRIGRTREPIGAPDVPKARGRYRYPSRLVASGCGLDETTQTDPRRFGEAIVKYAKLRA
jgi:hypothetical protein